MSKSVTKKWVRGFSMLVLVGVLGITGCSSQFKRSEPLSSSQRATAPAGQPAPSFRIGSPTGDVTQESSAGGITIDVTWQGETNGQLVFGVAMNTHSVDLDGYDLGKLAILVDDAGREYRPLSWKSAPGGHHRSGTLILPVPESLANVKYIELVIQDVGGVKERTLKWSMPSA